MTNNTELRTLALAAKAAAKTQHWCTPDTIGVSAPDAEYIAAASPDAILSLLDTIDEQKREIAGLRDALHDLIYKSDGQFADLLIKAKLALKQGEK